MEKHRAIYREKIKTRNGEYIYETTTKITNMMRTQTTNTTNNNTKHSRVENYTNIQFTHDEIQLLNKGLKYNLHYKNKKMD
jgi:hypothetical protein